MRPVASPNSLRPPTPRPSSRRRRWRGTRSGAPPFDGSVDPGRNATEAFAGRFDWTYNAMPTGTYAAPTCSLFGHVASRTIHKARSTVSGPPTVRSSSSLLPSSSDTIAVAADDPALTPGGHGGIRSVAAHCSISGPQAPSGSRDRRREILAGGADENGRSAASGNHGVTAARYDADVDSWPIHRDPSLTAVSRVSGWQIFPGAGRPSSVLLCRWVLLSVR